ncbi:hypothetical protein D9757_013565 [Collybiopsis confluens]|uniref:Uncharacterized protein n=1 Tax=Collybiopsis confluens TaxID=2823264 RepID=A0A8H5CRG0_9AGAR|nr:hypothetical protein D9757_013565 [Collybiopsis confluens]
MTYAPLQMFIEVFTNDVLPLVSSPMLWMAASILLAVVILWALHARAWCLSLHQLKITIKVTKELLKEYKENIVIHFLCDNVDCDEHKNRYKDHERRLLSIESIVHSVSEADYKAPFWRKYISFGRALSIVSGYRELRKLNMDIQQSGSSVLKGHNDYMLQTTHLRRRNAPNTPSTSNSEDRC